MAGPDSHDDFDFELSHQGSIPDERQPQLSHGQSSSSSRRDCLRIVKWLSELKATRPEMLRAVHAWTVLSRLGANMQSGCRSDDEKAKLYQRSFPTTSIDEFWSHSWHGKQLRKVLALLFYQNSTAAWSLSTLVAALMAVLFYLGLLPGWMKLSSYGPKQAYVHGIWSVGAGMLTYVAVLIWWRPHTTVFVDLFCIHQADRTLKAEGILNIGATLKTCKSLIVLWDETYLRRLWCVFELAAFLKAHQIHATSKVVLKPTSIGPATLLLISSTGALLLGDLLWPYSTGALTTALRFPLSFAAAAVATWPLLEHWKATSILERQLQSFTVSETTCSCCARGHHSDDPCDREIILATIEIWFGSIEEFERSVREDVGAQLRKQLGISPFGYSWLLHASTPILWAQSFDKAAALLLAGEGTWAAAMALAGLVWYFLTYPANFSCIEWGARWMSQRPHNRCATVALILAQCLLSQSWLVFYFVVMEYLPSPLLGTLCFTVASALFLALVLLLKSRTTFLAV